MSDPIIDELLDSESALAIAVGQKKAYWKKVRQIFGSSLVAVWPLDEQTGTVVYDKSGNGRNGTSYNVDPAQIKPPFRAPYLDGANDYIDLSAALPNLNGLAGAFWAWYKIADAGTYSDGTQDYIFEIGNRTTNRITAYKQNVPNQINFNYGGNGTVKSWAATGITSTAWQLILVTWSYTGNVARSYINNAQVNVDQTGFGQWNAASQIYLGCFANTPSAPCKGWLAYAGMTNRLVTAAEVARLYSLVGYINP